MTFRIGQKVVCVDDTPGPFYDKGRTLVRGTVYTIYDLEQVGAQLGVRLEEVGPKCKGLGYWSTRFRPVRITDITVFKNMLAPSPKVAVSEVAA